MEKIECLAVIKFLHLKINTTVQIKIEVDAVYGDIENIHQILMNGPRVMVRTIAEATYMSNEYVLFERLDISYPTKNHSNEHFLGPLGAVEVKLVRFLPQFINRGGLHSPLHP